MAKAVEVDPPLDPVLARQSERVGGPTRLLGAALALVLVAITAFWLIGTHEPSGEPARVHANAPTVVARQVRA